MSAGAASFPYLTAAIATPAVTGVMVALIPRARHEAIRFIGLLGAFATATLTIFIALVFDSHATGYQLTSDHAWVKSLGISWSLGIDGISLWLVVLTGILFPIALLGPAVHKDLKAYTAWLLLLEAGCIGSFVARDLFLFFVFFEVVLVPMYFLISGWGYANRSYAALKFFVYTVAGSAFLLVGILVLVSIHAAGNGGEVTFDLTKLTQTSGVADSRLLFSAFMIAFAVKVPLFPFHTWLPDAHTEAPTAGSVILAGVMLKLGTYGMLRFAIGLFPQAARDMRWLWLTLAVIGMIYGALVATMQTDLKRLVAYSSVAHLGFIVLGLFALTGNSLQGAVIQMVNHGISTPALFLLVGWLYERRHTRQIADLRGIWKVAPVMGGVFLLVTFSSIGLPGLNGFVGEFLVLIGSYETAFGWTVVGTTAVIFAALYMLWAFQRVFQGAPDEANAATTDLSWRERGVILPLLLLIVALGVYPKPVLDRIAPSTDALLRQVEARSDYREPRPPAPAHATTEAHPVIASLLAQVDAIQLPEIEYVTILPALTLIGGALLILTLSAIVPKRLPEAVWTTATLLTAGATAFATILQWRSITSEGAGGGARRAIASAVVLDGFSMWFALVAACCVALFALIADGYVQREGLGGPEIYVLGLLSASGAVLMAEAYDLLVLFLGLEILSIALYILAGFHRRKVQSGEAAMKYFVLGAFSSAIFLYGVALTYGATGSTRYDAIRSYLSLTPEESAAGTLVHAVENKGLVLAGMAMLLVGLGFKVAAVPFHAWTPDVYQGSPTPVTGFMAAAAKAAGFAGLLRLLADAFSPFSPSWRPAIWALAVLTLVVGSVLALVQDDVKRMLAYSSISHAGYVLVGVWAAGSTANALEGVTGAQYYLLTYAFIVLGTFAVVSVVSGPGDEATTLDAFRGLYQRRPALAVAMTLLLAAQAGIPFTTGFWAKLTVIKAALSGSADRGLGVSLALVAMLVTAVSAYFYLRVVLTMFQPPEGIDEDHLDEPGTVAVLVRQRAALQVPVGATIAIAISLLMTIGAGLWAGPLLDFAQRTLQP